MLSRKALLYKLRFQFFLSIQLMILFGPLLVPRDFNESIFTPILFLINIIVGINLLSQRRFLFWFFTFHFFVLLAMFGYSLVTKMTELSIISRFGLYFVFYVTISIEIVRQVLSAKYVDASVILGLMSGYVALGFLGFFFFMSIELLNPGAFEGVLVASDNFYLKADSIMYYSFITLLTIGYGEIVPVLPIAQKAAILIGLCGQFYMVIVTAVVIEKYIRNTAAK
ncbi:MAG: ion channel [Bacteroidota bacterium]